MDAIGVTEAARMLGVSRQRVLTLIRQQRIPAKRLDGSPVYTLERQDIFRFIRSRVTTTKPQPKKGVRN
jgi:excisionase family DNA binding protein